MPASRADDFRPRPDLKRQIGEQHICIDDFGAVLANVREEVKQPQRAVTNSREPPYHIYVIRNKLIMATDFRALR